MIKSQVVAGKHQRIEEEEADEVLKRAKTIDENLVNMRVQAIKNKKARLASTLHFVDAPKKNQRIVFVNSKEEAEKFHPVQSYESEDELEVSEGEESLDAYQELAKLDKDEQMLEDLLNGVQKDKEALVIFTQDKTPKKLVDEEHKIYKRYTERKR
jgi:hypothetical protein